MISANDPFLGTLTASCFDSADVGGALKDFVVEVLAVVERAGCRGNTGLEIDADEVGVLWTWFTALGVVAAGGSRFTVLSLPRCRSLSALRLGVATYEEGIDGFGCSPLICARRSPI